MEETTQRKAVNSMKTQSKNIVSRTMKAISSWLRPIEETESKGPLDYGWVGEDWTEEGYIRFCHVQGPSWDQTTSVVMMTREEYDYAMSEAMPRVWWTYTPEELQAELRWYHRFNDRNPGYLSEYLERSNAL